MKLKYLTIFQLLLRGIWDFIFIKKKQVTLDISLKFTTRFEDAEGSDIIISAGTLQYIESPMLFESLARLHDKPKYLLLNKLPLYEGAGYVTLQNAGCSFVAQHVFNYDYFINELSKIAYDVVDIWNVYELNCHIPFYPKNSFNTYTGIYLKAKNI